MPDFATAGKKRRPKVWAAWERGDSVFGLLMLRAGDHSTWSPFFAGAFARTTKLHEAFLKLRARGLCALSRFFGLH